MPLIQYVARKFSPKSLGMIENANKIITEYEAQGFDLTLRQLYYQFVARDLLPNTLREYKNLGSIINDARLAGMIDWNTIIDRTRNLEGNQHWDSPAQIVETCAKSYQIDKWETQPTRVEVWIEKDALIGVIERVCRSNDVSYFSCRGYTSQSEMWSASQRINEYISLGQRVVILHLGDHDPSGKDMSRDIQDRLFLFGCDNLEVRRIALNMDQVRKYKPPPNPAKITDSRASAYIKEFGSKSWELDALDPKTLHDLIEGEILDLREDGKYQLKQKEEMRARKRLGQIATELSGEDDE